MKNRDTIGEEDFCWIIKEWEQCGGKASMRRSKKSGIIIQAEEGELKMDLS